MLIMRESVLLTAGVIFQKTARGAPCKTAHGVGRLRRFLFLILSAPIWMFLTGFAQPVKPARLADDFVRTDFTVDDGLPDNVVNCVAQTANGLLWVGTEEGLASFDGRDFTRTELSPAGSMPQGAVHALLESSQGDLWVGTDAGIVFIRKEGLDRFDPSSQVSYRVGAENNLVNALAQTREGDVWAGTRNGLYRFESGRFVQVVALYGVFRINQALNGNLLLTVAGSQLLEWDGHRLIPHQELAANHGRDKTQIYQAFQDRSGTMWYATGEGLLRRSAQKLPPLEPSDVAAASISRIIPDRDGQLWVTSKMGLFRIDGDRLESPAPGLGARAFYPARDGDLWIGTNGYGLVHLRRRVVRMFTAADGLSNDNVMAVLPAHDGTLWIGSNCGFSSFDGSKFKTWSEKDGLLNTCVWALAEDQNHDLWIGTYGGGAFRMRGGKFTQYSKEQGLPERTVTQILPARDGSLWFATSRGLSRLQNGQFRTYTTADGLSSNQIWRVNQDRAGRLWVATQNGLDHLEGDRFLPFSSASVPNGHMTKALFEDSIGNLYTGEFPKGIGMIHDSTLSELNEDLSLRDMAESPEHDLWFAGKNGIVRMRRDDLMTSLQHREGPLDYEVYDRSDGLASVQCSVGKPGIVFDPQGNLWVATVKGLARIEPARRAQLRHAPREFVGGITVGKTKRLAGEGLTLPPGTHHLELHLQTVDLASPAKVRMQYRMEDVDSSWLDADSSQTAIYSNLPPGTHMFHVRASASDGIWDRVGTVYRITQQPYFYQTPWFLLLTFTVAVLLLSGGYLLRMRHVVGLAQMRMNERMVERERIARDLHDTLLQGVLGASMQLDLAEEHIDEGSTAKPLVRRTLQMLRQLTEEGRNTLLGLRSQDTAREDLTVALSRIPQEVPADTNVSFRVAAPAVPRALHAGISDDVYRIGREATLNAFLHAGASLIEVHIEHAAAYFRLVVRDNGRGMEPRILRSGREGHWGLPGMRERADRIGGYLRLKSRPGAGTEVELTVPAVLAFEGPSQTRISKWFCWLSGKLGLKAKYAGKA
jgi:ligand-binding sensor domain-containing protein/signal transduction histidine kinase